MKRKFFANLSLVLFLNLLIKPIWIFGIDRVVQNLVGPADYGFYFSLINFSLLFNIFLDLGLTNFNSRNIAQNQQLLEKHMANIVGVKWVLSVVYVLLSIVSGLVIGYSAKQIWMLGFLLINQVFISFTLYFRSNVSALHLFRLDGFLSVLDKLLMIIICGGALLSPLRENFRIEWFVYLQSFAYMLSMIIVWGVVWIISGEVKLRFKVSFSLVILRKAMPYALLVLMMSIYNRTDSVMLERLLPEGIGLQEAGIYAQAYRLLEALSNFGVLFAGLLLPIFSRLVKSHLSEVKQLVNFAFRLIIAPAILVAVVGIFYSDSIMSLLYQHLHSDSAALLSWLMGSFVAIATSYIFGTLLTANGNLRQLNRFAFAGMVLNILLNFYLIPRYQALGSAWASVATQMLMAVAQVLLSVRLFKMTICRTLLLKLAAYSSLLLIAGHQYRNWFSVPVGVLLLSATGLVLAFLLRLVSLKALGALLNRDESYSVTE